jgi:hypothetical protein
LKACFPGRAFIQTHMGAPRCALRLGIDRRFSWSETRTRANGLESKTGMEWGTRFDTFSPARPAHASGPLFSGVSGKTVLRACLPVGLGRPVRPARPQRSPSVPDFPFSPLKAPGISRSDPGMRVLLRWDRIERKAGIIPDRGPTRFSLPDPPPLGTPLAL